MNKQYININSKNAVLFGAIGGFIGGLLMYAIISTVMQVIGMGTNCFAVILALITGQPFSTNLIPIGISIHLATSIAIGIIFGLVVSKFNQLRVTGFVKGIGLGVATGLLAFIIIFLPISISLMPPKMMDLMKMMDSSMAMPDTNNNAMKGQMAMPDTQKIQSLIMLGSLLGHLVYGAILGLVFVVFLARLRKTSSSNEIIK